MLRFLLLHQIEVTDRHPRLMLAAAVALMLSAEWLADTGAGLICGVFG